MNTDHGIKDAVKNLKKNLNKFKDYEICVFFSSNYVCSGSFYDSFEYFWLLRKFFKTCLVFHLPADRKYILNALYDKYDVQDIPDLYVYPLDKKLLNIRCNILFSPSSSSIARMINKSIILFHNKILISHEIPITDEYFGKAFFDKKWMAPITFLYDNFSFKPMKNYKNILYNQTLYFDIMKDPGESADYCLVNMCTDHKCYQLNELEKILKTYMKETDWNFLIYTKPDNYVTYKFLQSDRVKIVNTPVNNFMKQFNKLLYLPSARGFDPSPRLIPECKYFGKEVYYHNFRKEYAKHWKGPDGCTDGGMTRALRVGWDFESLIMKEDDKIIDIIKENL